MRGATQWIRDQLALHPCGLRSGLFLTDPRSLGLLNRRAGTKDQGSVVVQWLSSRTTIILLAFVGASP